MSETDPNDPNLYISTDHEFDVRQTILERVAKWEVMLDSDLEDCYTIGSRIAQWESMLAELDGSAE